MVYDCSLDLLVMKLFKKLELGVTLKVDFSLLNMYKLNFNLFCRLVICFSNGSYIIIFCYYFKGYVDLYDLIFYFVS